MYRIGEFSKMSKTTIKALIYYDEIGLLKPECVDDFTGYRFYTTDQLVKLHRIQALKQAGLSIDEIKLIISGYNFKSILEKRKTELKEELARGTEQLSRVEFILSGREEKDIHVEFCEGVDKMKDDFDDIKFKKIEAVTAVSVMHKGAYAGLSKAYAYAFKWIEENGYAVIDSPRENYIDGIWNRENEEDWLTELQIPAVKNNK